MLPSRLFRRVLHTVFPMPCRTCDTALWDDPVPFFCQGCWDRIVPILGPSCPRCACPFPSPHVLSHSPDYVCGACRARAPAYDRAWTPYAYRSPLKEAIGLLKYHGKTQLAPPLAHLIARTTPAPMDVDVIIAVPLHPDRPPGTGIQSGAAVGPAFGQTLESARAHRRAQTDRDSPLRKPP